MQFWGSAGVFFIGVGLIALAVTTGPSALFFVGVLILLFSALTLLLALTRPDPAAAGREASRLYSNGKVDKGQCLSYWQLSYRRRWVRDLSLLPPLLVLNAVIMSAQQSSSSRATGSFALLLLVFAASASYNLYRWNRDERGRPPVPATQVSAAPLPAAGWYPDPGRRHELRYWDSTAWTAHVSDNGVVRQDSLSRQGASA
jgi:hypothetical protein